MVNTESEGEIVVRGMPGVVTKVHTPMFGQLGRRYEVEIEGGFVRGDSGFVVGEGNRGCYEMQYCPLKEMNCMGKVSFVDRENNREIWYVLKLSVEKPSPIIIPLVQAEIGGSKTITIPINNPL